jgi:hypothetical protein
MPAAQADPPRPRGAGRNTSRGETGTLIASRPAARRTPDAYTTIQYMKGYLYKYPCVLRFLFKTSDTVEYFY